MTTTTGPEQSRDPTDDDFDETPAPNHRQWLLNMCARKSKTGVFNTWHHAEAAAKRTNRRRKGNDRHVAPFICPVCHRIHVGSKPKRIKGKGKKP